MYTHNTITSCHTAIARGQRIRDRSRSDEHDSSPSSGLAKRTRSVHTISTGIFSVRGPHTPHRLYVKCDQRWIFTASGWAGKSCRSPTVVESLTIRHDISVDRGGGGEGT